MDLSKEQMEDFLVTYCDEIREIEGIEKTFDPCETMVVSKGPDIAAVQSDPPPTSRVSVAGVIGVALAALLLLLVAVLALRKRQRETYPLKHHVLDDGGGDDDDYDDSTYLKDDFDATTAHMDAFSTPERRTHIVGEADSIVSGWSDFSKNNKNRSGASKAAGDSSPKLRSFEDMQVVTDRHVHNDVHVCSSATCEVCEQRRQDGLQFIPTGMPSHSIPSDECLLPPRDYVASDTVQL